MQPRSLPASLSVTKVRVHRAQLCRIERRLDGERLVVVEAVDDRRGGDAAQRLAVAPKRRGGRVLGLVDRPGAIADDPVARPGGVARIAQIQRRHRHAARLGEREQALDRQPAAGLLAADIVGPHFLDRLAGPRVELARGVVVEVVAQVRRDDDHRLGPAPQRLDHLGDVLDVGGADDKRHQREVVEHALQEGQLDLEAVLLAVRLVVGRDLGQRERPLDRRAIQRYRAERRGELLDGRRGEAVEGDAMRRAEQHGRA